MTFQIQMHSWFFFLCINTSKGKNWLTEQVLFIIQGSLFMNSFKDFLGVGFYNPVTIMLSNLEANRNIFRESSNSWSICLQSTTYYVLLKPASTQSNISLEANHNIFRESKNLSIRSQNMAYYMCALLNKWASAQLNINLQETSWQNGYLQCSFFLKL